MGCRTSWLELSCSCRSWSSTGTLDLLDGSENLIDVRAVASEENDDRPRRGRSRGMEARITARQISKPLRMTVRGFEYVTSAKSIVVIMKMRRMFMTQILNRELAKSLP